VYFNSLIIFNPNKIMIRISLLILIFLFSFSYGFAGGDRGIYDVYPSAEKAKQVLSRPLIIQKKEIDPKEREKLLKKDPEGLKLEENITQLFNDVIVNVFKENYKGSNNISLMSLEEIGKLDVNNSTVIKHNLYRNCYTGPDHKKHCETTYTFFITLGNSAEQQGRFSFTDDMLTEEDLLFLCQQINNVMADAAAGKPNPSQNDFFEKMKETAKGKTLVLSPRELGSKFTKEEIRKVYNGDLEFVDSIQFLNKYILEKKAGKMYIATGYNGPLYGVAYYLVDAETGKIISAMASGGFRVSIGTRPRKEQLKPFNYSFEERQKMTTILYEFKPQHNLTKTHFKYWSKKQE
jgi:hypothetical protein